jgi:hypothetical protein
MPDIKSVDNYWASQKQNITYGKTGARTTIAQGWYSLFDLAGEPGAGTLSVGNTANGIVPSDAQNGVPVINAFNASAIGRLTRIGFTNSVPCRMRVFDRLFSCGAYAFNANTALASQPSFASRVNFRNPVTDTDANDYKNLQLWVEQVTAATGNQAVNVTYTDQDGNAGATTGAVGIGAAPTLGRCWQLPLAAGDSGLQQITNVQGSVATVGTFNVHVLRPLSPTLRVPVAGAADILDQFKTGGPQVFADSSLFVLLSADSTSSGLPDLELEIANF